MYVFVLEHESGEYDCWNHYVVGTYATPRIAMRAAARQYPLGVFTWRGQTRRQEFEEPTGVLYSSSDDVTLTITPMLVEENLGLIVFDADDVHQFKYRRMMPRHLATHQWVEFS